MNKELGNLEDHVVENLFIELILTAFGYAKKKDISDVYPKSKPRKNNLIKAAKVPAAVKINNNLIQSWLETASEIKALLAKPLKGGIPDMAKAATQKVAAVIGIRLPKPPKFSSSRLLVA